MKIDYDEVLRIFRTTLPELPDVLKMTDGRRKALRKLWKDYEMDMERWGAYLRYISKKCRWMLEDRPDTNSGKTWRKKDFDYLITEKCYLKVKEERADDLPKVQRQTAPLAKRPMSAWYPSASSHGTRWRSLRRRWPDPLVA